MSRTNRSSIRQSRRAPSFDHEDFEFHPDLVPVDEALSDTEVHTVLDAVIRSHRGQLVAIARQRLGNRRGDAEDLVHEVCLDAMEGHLPMAREPRETLDILIREVATRAKEGDR